MNNIVNKTILKYSDVKIIKSGDSTEPLVDVRKYCADITTNQGDGKTSLYDGTTILVRDTVAKKLANISSKLKNNMRLNIACGYRDPKIQRNIFKRERAKILNQNPGISSDYADELTHALIAVPDVAGHTVGGAVDITIIDSNDTPLDMGTDIADFNSPDKIATYSSLLTKKQSDNRKLLHDLMISENFAPFYGEWWHFSYGDKEWAAFYNHDKAIYSEYFLK